MALVVILNINSKDSKSLKIVDNREYTKPELKKLLKDGLSLMSDTILFYDNFEAFKSNVNLHLSDYIINFDFGYKSRLRNMTVPSFCSLYDIEYFNPDPYVQIICQDKFITKAFVMNFGLSSPKGVLLFSEPIWKNILEQLNFPFIIKPNYESESIGITQKSIVNNLSEAKEQTSKLLEEFDGVLIEEYIEGDEVALTIFSNGKELFLGEVELKFPKGKGITYEAYTAEVKRSGGTRVKRSHHIAQKDLEALCQLYKSLSPNKLIRIDGRMKGESFYLLEINANPGLYPSSIVPQTFKLYGYNYQQMLTKLFQKKL